VTLSVKREREGGMERGTETLMDEGNGERTGEREGREEKGRREGSERGTDRRRNGLGEKIK